MRRKTLGFLSLILFVLSAGLQAQFARTYGGKGSDIARKILPTSDGGLLVCGYSSSFSGAWVLKLDAAGAVQWEKAYTAFNLTSVCPTADNGYMMIGADSSGAWLIKTNGLGAIEWQKSVTSASFTSWASTICPAGNSGYFAVIYSGMLNEPPHPDIWVIKLSSQGEIVWQKIYDTGNWYQEARVEPAGGGGCVIAGTVTTDASGHNYILAFQIDSSGAVLWRRSVSVAVGTDCTVGSIRKTNDGGFVLGGWLHSMASSSDDMFVLKLGASGGVEWAKSYGKPGDAGALDIFPTADGGSIVAGDSSGDIALVKLQGNGEIEWQKSFGGSLSEEGRAVAQVPGGDYVVAGSSDSFGAGVEDFCVLRLLADGSLGSCRVCKTLSLQAAALEVNPADLSLSVQDTTSTLETANLAVTDTSGSSKSYQLCSTKKVLTISLSGVSTASAISPNPGTYLHNPGDSVTIQATPVITIGDTKYDFSGWEGDYSGSTNPLTFTITDDTSVRASYYEEWGGGGGGGGGDIYGKSHCFIATAAYRSPLHPAVKLLQDFRDKRLLTNPLGRAFVAAYYSWSPTIASAIGRSAPLRLISRIILVPVIGAAALVLTLGWPVGLAIMVAGPFLAIRKIRSRRKKKLCRL
jgi:hypothetical protein